MTRVAVSSPENDACEAVRLRRIFDMYRCGLSMPVALYDHDVEPILSTLL